ncbi:hypothetical protein L0F63_006929, partial [Massospora cicadina]
DMPRHRSSRRQPRKHRPHIDSADIQIQIEPIPQADDARVTFTEATAVDGQSCGVGDRPANVDPASFGLVDPNLQHYFKNLERAISSKPIDGKPSPYSPERFMKSNCVP